MSEWYYRNKQTHKKKNALKLILKKHKSLMLQEQIQNNYKCESIAISNVLIVIKL